MHVQPALTSDTRTTKDSILFNDEQRKMEKKTFEEWKAATCFEIEDLADYFMIHDTENYFVNEKYLEAYKKIESLCKLAFDRK